MFDDENLSLYAYVLMLSGVIFGASFFAGQREIEVAALTVDAVELGAIETASIPREAAPEGAEAWNCPAIPWRTYEDGMQEMARTNKPGILVLQAEWCLVCKNYQRLFEDPEVKKKSEDYVFILGDVDKQPDLQRRYNVDGDYIPRTFALTPDGDLKVDATGAHERQRFFVDPYKSSELLKLLNVSN